MMRKIKLVGFGRAIADQEVRFGDQMRYRLGPEESFLDLTDLAIGRAMENAGLTIDDIDCIVCAMAIPLQPLPCNAALIHERVAIHREIPAMDINTSCTSFLSALDILSYLIEAGRYRRVLVVSGDAASHGLNPEETESYELFSDAATAFVVAGSQGESGILYSAQQTWSTGAHDTEIAGGGSLLPPLRVTEKNRRAYTFHMDGVQALRRTMKALPDFLDKCFRESGMERGAVNRVIPHQASRALGMLMTRLGFAKEAFEDQVAIYGNMVSASIPYTLCDAIEGGRIHRGDTLLLLGTAAGLTANFMLLRY